MNDLAALIQGTPEWLQARAGSLGASEVHTALARIDKGKNWGATSAALRKRLGAERLINKPIIGYSNQNMFAGKEREPEAREAYCWAKGVDVQEVGIIVHPRIRWTHCSPDGFVADDGILELKCPTPEVHYDRLRGANLDQYLLQCCWLLACTGRQWVDLCSYHPDFKRSLLITRMVRDDDAIARTERLVEEFLREIENELAEVRE
jgi:exodeoxyribonuclease (lambda-induced)